jgi:hypothetical protein
MQDILHQDEPYYPVYDPYLVQAIRSDRFTGVPAGLLPPLYEGTTQDLVVSVRPIVTPTQNSQTTAMSTSQTTATGAMSTEGLVATTVVAIAALVLVGVLVTRRKSSKKGQ